jgi:hypothetical protein
MFLFVSYNLAIASPFDVGAFGPTGGDVDVGQNSFICKEVNSTPSVPGTNKLKVYCKDNAGVPALYTLDYLGNETLLGTGGGSGGGGGTITQYRRIAYRS